MSTIPITMSITVAMIMAIADALKLDVIVEGVETPGQVLDAARAVAAAGR